MKKLKAIHWLKINKAFTALLICMSFLLNVQVLNAQNQKINVMGVVRDATGEPIIGASVLEKGTTTGTITDFDGNFSLSVSSQGTLVISYIGYLSQEIPVSGKSSFIVTLKEDAQTLDEVVVVGFGVQKKVNLTGSVGIATAKDLEARPVANAVQALQGVIPGLNISNSGNGGELNATKTINIRGTGTVGKGADDKDYTSGAPLILIDGMEGDINTINPQDIESISVLKDAAASSIYGSRAPFGVVLVTTKSGKSGRASINYNNSFRFNTPVKMPSMMNSWQFVNFFDDAEFNNSNKHLYEADYMQKVKDYMDGKDQPVMEPWGDGRWNYDYPYANVNWLKEYYKDWSPSQEHNVSVSGGTDKLTYYLSGNYMTQDGFMRYGTENYDRYTMTAKISAQITDYVKVDYSNRFVRTKYSRPTSMNDSFYDQILRRARPVRPIYDPNGYMINDIHYAGVMSEGGRHKDENDVVSQQLRATITPLKNWNIIAEMNVRTGNDWTHWDQIRVYSHNVAGEQILSQNTNPANDQVYEQSYKYTFLNPNIYTNYNISFGEHNLAATAGFQSEQMKNRKVNAQRTVMDNVNQPVLDLTTGTMLMSGNYQEWTSAGFFGRVNYDYQGKYLVEGNLRYDGSSRYRKDERWVWTPSFSLGWNIAREAFFENAAEYVQMLKLRGSYGVLANQNTTNWYPTYAKVGTTSADGKWLINGGKPNTASVPGLVSTSLTWEKIYTTNIGLDFGAFNNRLTGSFDYFNRKTKDMVGKAVELPAILGTDVPVTNNTDLKTYGWELELSWRDQIGQVKYGARLNISDSQTKITRFANPTGSLSSGMYREGEVIGNIYGYTTIGIAKTDKEMEDHLASLPDGGQSALGSNWAAGDIMYADLNGDGKINNGSNTIDDMGDLKKIGNNTPRFRTGINLDASWKGFDVQMFWQGVFKRDFDPGENSMVFWGATGSGQWWSTAFKDHLDYYRADADHNLGQNLNAYYPRPLFNNKNHKTQTKYLQNAAYMRLKNLQLGYTFPKVWVNKLMLQNLRIFVSGENLLTITSLSDTMDPETAGIGRQGGTVYPLSRTYSFGLSVNF